MSGGHRVVWLATPVSETWFVILAPGRPPGWAAAPWPPGFEVWNVVRHAG